MENHVVTTKSVILTCSHVSVVLASALQIKSGTVLSLYVSMAQV